VSLAPEQIDAAFVGVGAGPLESPGVGLGLGPADGEAIGPLEAGGVSDEPELGASEALGAVLGGTVGVRLGAGLDELPAGPIVGAAEPQAARSRIAPARSKGSRAVRAVRGRMRVTGQA
jgi:hypothetical protein